MKMLFLTLAINFLKTDGVTIRVTIRDYDEDTNFAKPISVTVDDTEETAFAAEAELEAKLIHFEQSGETHQFNEKDQELWDELVANTSDDYELLQLNEFLADVNLFGDGELEGSGVGNATIVFNNIVSKEDRKNQSDNVVPTITQLFTIKSVDTTTPVISYTPSQVMINDGIVESLHTIAEILKALVSKLVETDKTEPVFDKRIDTSGTRRISASWEILFWLFCLLLKLQS